MISQIKRISCSEIVAARIGTEQVVSYYETQSISTQDPSSYLLIPLISKDY